MFSTDVLLNDFAIRSFREIADGDYIAARLSFRARLIPQFLWQSLQAIEKYLKNPASTGPGLVFCLQSVNHGSAAKQVANH